MPKSRYFTDSEDKNWKRLFEHPDKLKLKGNWRLNKNHDLELVLSQSDEHYGQDILVLRGQIIAVSSDELAFLISSKKDRGVEVSRILKLKGKWKADNLNRLGFAVSKENGKEDLLVLDGIWDVGKNNELIYRYEKTDLVRKTKEKRSLIFKGFWQISQNDRLAYLLDTSGESGFLFKAQLENPSIRGKVGAIQYRVGTGLTKYKRPVERVIKFFGEFKLNLTKKDELLLELTNSRRKKLGVSVKLTRKLLGGEAFLRFKKIAEESRAEAGLRIPW